MAAKKSANDSNTAPANDSRASATDDVPDVPVAGATGATGVVAPLALLASIAALLLGAWAVWQQVGQTDSSVAAGSVELAAIEQRLARFTDNLAAQQRSITDVEDALQGSLAVVADLPRRLAQMEQQLASIPGINAQSRSDWLKAEAVYYLRLANAQASLAGNAKVATSALQLADDKLRESGDPTVGPVRAQLSDEIAALQALPEVDRAGITFRMQTLAAQVDDWSFPAIAPDSYSPGIAPPADELGPWDRLMATLRAVFTSIVSIKETEAPQAAQLGVAEQALIRESVKAELQVARLAFVSGNVELFAQSLGRVEQQIDAYFDAETASVAAALSTLKELRSVEMPGELPDISGSLALLLKRIDNSPVNNPASKPVAAATSAAPAPPKASAKGLAKATNNVSAQGPAVTAPIAVERAVPAAGSRDDLANAQVEVDSKVEIETTDEVADATQ
jgi:uroporphyrin-3 C-methyltransferase